MNVPHVLPPAELRGHPWLERPHCPPVQTEVSAVRPEVSQTILSITPLQKVFSPTAVPSCPLMARIRPPGTPGGDTPEPGHGKSLR